ncbi:S9 family peptidase [Embleya sp. NPDC005971]|uniref:alpha/beta hydrolase family protein n=1 Tax=Embleya sp. NPDC005971 TaxID=3156724 RepID=UPI00340EB4CE
MRYERVLDHLHALHRPGFGRPSSLREPHVTRDGSRTVVTADVLHKLAGVPRTALFTAEDGRFRQVSAPGGSARSGRFSPDGRTLAFLSDRADKGVYQLHLRADDRLGEAEAAPAVPGTVEYLHWSPDGRRILLGVAGLGAELSGGQGSGTNRRGIDDAPPWFPRVDADVADEAWRSLWLYTPATGVLERLSPEGLNCWEAGWCGPGRVAAVTSEAPWEDSWYGAVLSLIDLDGAVHRVLDSKVQLGLPTGSPTGRWVAVAEAVCSDRWLVAGDLLLIDGASGAVRRIDTLGTDVTRLEWIDDERLGYLGQRRLDSVAGIVRVGDGSVSEVLVTANACGGSTFHTDGAFTDDGRVCTIQESYRLPQQLVLSGRDGDRVLASTAHEGTDYLRSVAGTAEAVTWSAPDGLEIDGILCRPAGDGPFPLVVNIHGGPIWQFRDMWSMKYPWVPLLVSRGYAVLNPNPRGSSGRGQAFAGLVVGDMGGADTLDYLSGIDALVERGVVDGSRVGLIGASYGGYMSSWLVTQDPRFAAAVPISPVTDWYSQGFTSNIAAWGNRFLDADPTQPGSRVHTRSPVLHAAKARTPCLNIAGALDNCTPPTQAQEFHHALRAHGVPSVLVIYPQEGHGVRAYPAQIDFMTRMLDWFERYMPGEGARATHRETERTSA